jgi:hypothetical protein
MALTPFTPPVTSHYPLFGAPRPLYKPPRTPGHSHTSSSRSEAFSCSPPLPRRAHFTAKAPSSARRLLTVVRARVSSLPVVTRHARPVSTLTASHRGPERPLGQAPASLAVGHGGEVHDGPVYRRPRRWSTSHGPSPWNFLLENNSKIKYPSHFSFRPLSLSEINPQSLISSVLSHPGSRKQK